MINLKFFFSIENVFHYLISNNFIVSWNYYIHNKYINYFAFINIMWTLYIMFYFIKWAHSCADIWKNLNYFPLKKKLQIQHMNPCVHLCSYGLNQGIEFITKKIFVVIYVFTISWYTRPNIDITFFKISGTSMMNFKAIFKDSSHDLYLIKSFGIEKRGFNLMHGTRRQ